GENINEEDIFVTGNTVIDALLYSVEKVKKLKNDKGINKIKSIVHPRKDILLVTGHRRESFGQGFVNICHALK
ncbi:unnamed protein product, partial [marine sediment metagenome]